MSYPLSVNSVDDFVFNHLSILYWFSLSLLLASMYMIAVTFENKFLRWIMTVGIVMAMYSTSYFYYSLSTADANLFGGLNEYFAKARILDFSQVGKSYFQWPAFFILTDIATSVSGLELANFEFLMYTIIGFLLTTTLYIYASKAYKNGGFLAVVAFFIAMFSFLNFQFVAFTIAFGLLLLLLTLDTQRWNSSMILTMLVLFTSMTLTHAFVPLFFVIFLLIKSIISRNKQYGVFFLLTLIIYLVYQITSTNNALESYIRLMQSFSTEIPRMVGVKPVFVPIDAIAQKFFVAILITTVTICVAGFIILLIKRKMRDLDKAVFLTGAVYFGLGVMLWVLGSRAIPLAFIPVSLGASYLFGTRFKPYLKSFFLVLLILFSFISLHASFANEIFVRTKESYTAENFFIDHWTNRSFTLANWWVADYFESKLTLRAYAFSRDPLMIKEVDTIFYTVTLGLQMRDFNYTIEKIINEERLNVVYSSGSSIVATRS